MNFTSPFLSSGTAILLLMTLLWLLSLTLKNSSIVDIFWGAGFILIVWLVFALAPQGYLPRRQLVALLVTIWGARLTLHIGSRNWGKPEDFRYARWREENGPRWWWMSYFKVFLLQGLIMRMLSAPLIAAQASGFPAILTPMDLLGMCIWGAGLLFESVADAQLTRFKKDPANRGKILTSGLWKFSRHPNYFGEAALWWGYYLLALAAAAGWTVFAPLLMTFLLVKVSGVAMLEKTLKTKPGYTEYINDTNAFVPWFPKQ
jgi:steroid 5-alpha reductase family enzyme